MFFFTVKFSLLELRWAFDTISSLSLTPQAVSAGSPLSTTIPLPSATVSSAPPPPAHTRVAHRNLAASLVPLATFVAHPGFVQPLWHPSYAFFIIADS